MHAFVLPVDGIVMHRLRRVIGFFLVAVLISSLTTCEPHQRDGARYLVVICIDGCRPDYFQMADIPNIEGLMKTGVYYRNAWVGQLLSNTPAGHTAISTGAFSKNNGVLGYSWRDPKTGEIYQPTCRESVTSGEFTAVITDSGTGSIGSLYKKTHPKAKVAAVGSVDWLASASLGGVSSDFILFASTGEGLARPDGVEGYLASDQIMNAQELERELGELGDGDSWATDLALKLFNEERPEILLISLPATDAAGHDTGGITDPAVMGEVISNVDRQIGRLVDAYKKSGIYDETLFVITADHGMTPNMRNLCDVAINDAIAGAGTDKLLGGSSFWLENPTKAAEIAEGIAHAEIPGILGTFHKEEVDGNLSYIASPTTQKRLTADLEECFRYLTATCASDKSPDAFTLLAENSHFGMYPLASHGEHNDITWLTQHIPLVVSGPGVKQGVTLDTPARLVDIAPTVCNLMGVEPQDMDGIVLADAMISPTGEQADAQRQSIRDLIPMQEALRACSEADLESGYDQPAVEGPWQTAGGWEIVMVVAPKDFSQAEYGSLRGIFESVGMRVTVASSTLDEAITEEGRFGIKPDITVGQIIDHSVDAIIVIGGRGSNEYLWSDRELQQVLTGLYAQDKIVSAIGLSPVVLARAGLLEDKPATARPSQDAISELKMGGAEYRDEAVVVAGRIVTGPGPKATSQLAREILRQVSLVRCGGE